MCVCVEGGGGGGGKKEKKKKKKKKMGGVGRKSKEKKIATISFCPARGPAFNQHNSYVTFV